jgi:hypothetical protein
MPASTQTPDCDTVALLRSQIHQVHQLLDEQVGAAAKRAQSRPSLHRDIRSLYVHALCVEDTTVNLLVQARMPLFTRIWIGAQLVPWDLASMQVYAEVVHGATDVLLAHLTPADLRRSIDLSDVGLGTPDLTWVLNRFILWETATTCGELAATGGGKSAKPLVLPRQVVPTSNGRSNGVHRTSLDPTNGVALAKASPVTARSGG